MPGYCIDVVLQKLYILEYRVVYPLQDIVVRAVRIDFESIVDKTVSEGFYLCGIAVQGKLFDDFECIHFKMWLSCKYSKSISQIVFFPFD